MNESITSRVGRIISGSLNAIVDAVENAAPEAVMQEAIREIDSAVDDVRTELGRVIATKHLATTRLMDENRKHTELTEKLELAVKQNRDDLAETAIAAQLNIEAQIPVLETTIADTATQEKELEGYITALKAKKREMEEELDQYRSVQQQASATHNGVPSASTDVTSQLEKASTTFDRVMKNASGIGSNSGMPDRHDAAKMAELDDLARQNRIQERLAEVKKSV